MRSLLTDFMFMQKREKKNDDDNVDDCVNYITRYTSRPPMAENHIIKYEDDKKIIKWWYNRHEDEEYVEVYEKVEDFINNLILHCPDENFKMVRYYDYSLVIAPVVAELCTTSVALSAPPNSYQNNSQS